MASFFLFAKKSFTFMRNYFKGDIYYENRTYQTRGHSCKTEL